VKYGVCWWWGVRDFFQGVNDLCVNFSRGRGMCA